MLSPFADLCVLSAAMAVGTFFFGVLPLSLRLSRLTLRILEVGGAGLLMGAAASVVLPEGAATLFRAAGKHEHHHHERQDSPSKIGALQTIEEAEPESVLAISFLAGMLVLFIIDQIMSPGAHAHTTHGPHHGTEETQGRPQSRSSQEARRYSRMSRPETMILTRSNAVPTLRSLDMDGRSQSISEDPQTQKQTVQHAPASSSQSPPISEASVASLPSDYHTMQHDGLGEAALKNHSIHSAARATDASNGTAQRNSHKRYDSTTSSPSSPLLAAASSPPGSPSRNGTRRRSGRSWEVDDSTPGQVEQARGLRAAFTSVVGLVIHAACDGIAMGATSAAKDESLKLVVLGAIMIHKAPAAFGLCTLLISQRLSRSDIKRAMAIFSLATPIGALGTYLILSFFLGSDAPAQIPGGVGGEAGSQPAVSPLHVGAALSFSAGSFIYVALDAVHELASSVSDTEGEVGDEAQSVGRPRRQTLGRSGRIATLLLGAVLPKALQAAIGHGH